MLGLYRKGRKNTLLYSEHAERLLTPEPGTDGLTTHANPMISYFRPLIFENRREVKSYLLLHDVEDEYEIRPINIT